MPRVSPLVPAASTYPSTKDEHSDTNLERYTARSEFTRANTDASAPSGASSGSNVSHDTDTSGFSVRSVSVSVSFVVKPDSSAARTTTRHGCPTGSRGSTTARLPKFADARMVDGNNTSSAQRPLILASATQPGAVVLVSSRSWKSSSASSSMSANRNASTRALIRVATRVLPVSRETREGDTVPGECAAPLLPVCLALVLCVSPEEMSSPGIAASAARVGRRAETHNAPTTKSRSTSTPAYFGDDAGMDT